MTVCPYCEREHPTNVGIAECERVFVSLWMNPPNNVVLSRLAHPCAFCGTPIVSSSIASKTAPIHYELMTGLHHKPRCTNWPARHRVFEDGPEASCPKHTWLAFSRCLVCNPDGDAVLGTAAVSDDDVLDAHRYFADHADVRMGDIT